MNYNFIFNPEALSEYQNASVWYEHQKDGLSIQFEKEIENVLSQIKTNPYTYSLIKNAYRQAKANVFPFVIGYKINERKREIYVSAIYHAKRNPREKFRKQ
jgi:mRNA-degrading endonuclease RelE of RelBE toxin-antitoxin system